MVISPTLLIGTELDVLIQTRVMSDVVQDIAQLIANKTEFPVEVSGDLTVQIHPQAGE